MGRELNENESASADYPAGCAREPHLPQSSGWSNRLMFRPNGVPEHYMYLPGREDCGIRYPWTTTFEAGKWQDVTLFIQLNTPGVASASLYRGNPKHCTACTPLLGLGSAALQPCGV